MDSITSALQTLTLTPSTSSSHAKAITTLVQPSRESQTLRHQLSDPKILSTILETLVSSLQDDLETADQALRCIANACIDNDTARENISRHIGFSWAISCLKTDDGGIRLLTTKVLNNICFEHEEAQKKCYQDCVHFALIDFLASDFAKSLSHECKLAGDLDSAIDVLFSISGQKEKGEATTVRQEVALPQNLWRKVLAIHDVWFEDWDVDTWATLTEIVLVFLRDPAMQVAIVQERLVHRVRLILEKQEAMIKQLERAAQKSLDSATQLPLYCNHESAAEDIKLLAPLNASLVWCLSDIAATPGFAEKYPLDDPEITKALSIIRAATGSVDADSGIQHRVDPNGPIFNASCQVIGNLLWATNPAETYSFLVLEYGLHESLFNVIVNSNVMPDGLHSIGGLLVQLARPSIAARERMGNCDLAPHAIERLVRHGKPEIKQGSIKLLKALGKDCPANQRRYADMAAVAMTALQPSDSTRDAADSVVELEE